MAATQPALRVVFAEDNFLVREGTAALLAEVDEIELVRLVEDPPSLMKAVADLRPDAVLTDIRMPPTYTTEGIAAARRIRSEFPGTGVVVLSQYVEPDYAFELLADGVAGLGYLLKERVREVDELIRALQDVCRGGSALDPKVVEGLVYRKSAERASPLRGLTDRELQVLREVTRGLFPLVLMRQGLAAALRSHFARTGLSEVLRIAPPMEGRRFEQRAETAAYFCSLAVMRDVVMPARLALTIEDGNLVLEMTGGSPRPVRPVDERRAIVDRVEAVGGRVSEAGDPDGRFALRVEIPAGQAREANAQTAASRSVPKADLAT